MNNIHQNQIDIHQNLWFFPNCKFGRAKMFATGNFHWWFFTNPFVFQVSQNWVHHFRSIFGDETTTQQHHPTALDSSTTLSNRATRAARDSPRFPRLPEAPREARWWKSLEKPRGKNTLPIWKSKKGSGIAEVHPKNGTTSQEIYSAKMENNLRKVCSKGVLEPREKDRQYTVTYLYTVIETWQTSFHDISFHDISFHVSINF